MEKILLAIHLLACFGVIGIVLVQRSESSGGLGIGGGNMAGLMSARGTANFLTKTTAVLAAILMASTLAMAVLHKSGHTKKSLIDTIVEQNKSAPAQSIVPATVPEAQPEAQTKPDAIKPDAPKGESKKPSVPMAQ